MAIHVTAVCPHCKSADSLYGLDVVTALACLSGFTRDANGNLEPDWAGDTDVLWDSQKPKDPAKPYYCQDCEKTLALSDLVIESEDDDEDEDEDEEDEHATVGVPA